jgi:hypothetical protein
MSDEAASEIAVMDEEEYKQMSRVRTLLEARQKVKIKSDEAQELYVLGEIDTDIRDAIVFEAVQQLIREGWVLLMDWADDNAEDEGRTNYLINRRLGAFEVGGRRVAFDGLLSFKRATPSYSEDVARTRTFPHGSDATVTETVEKVVPRRISWEAYDVMSEFLLREQGLKMRTRKARANSSFGFVSGDVVTDHDLIDERLDQDADLRALKPENATNGENGEVES